MHNKVNIVTRFDPDPTFKEKPDPVVKKNPDPDPTLEKLPGKFSLISFLSI